MTDHRVRRTIMITPGHREARLAKAVTLDVDSVAFDIEDGVPPNEKAAARVMISNALKALDFDGRERVVRVNAVGTDELPLDLAVLPLDRIDALFVPKVGNAEMIHELETMLAPAEKAAGRETRMPTILTIETAEGLFNVKDIATASDRAVALFFGSGDYAAETGCRITPETLQVPRALIAAAAGLGGLQAIDAAYFLDVKNEAETQRDAETARDFGFCGKLIFHPNQIAVTNAVFTPTPAEVTRA
ncbi:MAG: CoA ester lyase, partial [Alphaproteobacteria bacterium]|nr:CoA ester lyase [Alphaproteobacteria bacterium]